MKVALRQIVLSLAVLACASSARADLSLDLSFPPSPTYSADLALVSSSPLNSLSASTGTSQEWSSELLTDGDGLLDSLYPGSIELPKVPVLREMRPLPSSAALFFTAMLSLGGLHVFRHPPSLHLSALPNWYHTGGAVQVGHVTPFDLDFQSLTLCVFDLATSGVEDSGIVCKAAADQVNRLLPQVVLSPAAPRGPPLAA